MKVHRTVLLALVLGSAVTAGRAAEHPAITVSSLTFGPFGTVTLYQTSPHPRHVVLFASGDGGWKLGVVDMARALATQDALVAGFNTVHYLHALEHGAGRCAYAAADLETLSQYLQKRSGRAHYTQPVLAGYSSGATLVYVALAQAPPNTFRGGLSLGFGPDLPVTKPFCRGAGLKSAPLPKHKGYRFIPGQALAAPWAVLQGTIDQVAIPAQTEAFVTKVPGARLIILPKVGHGYSVPRHWMPQFHAAFQYVARAPASPSTAAGAALKGLPLVEVPAAKEQGDTLGVVISGDGGWAGIDRQLAEQLAAEGIPVVGLDSLQYFWSRRTPDGAALDLGRILNHYLARWHRQKVILIGYSRGADVLPFMADRLAPELRRRIAVIALLGLSPTVDFEFHLTDWLHNGSNKERYAVLPQVERLQGPRVLCFYGAAERDSLCRKLDPARYGIVEMPGGHHFDGRYQAIAGRILAAAQARQERGAD